MLTSISLVVIAIVGLHYSKLYYKASNPGIAIVAPVVCLQIELFYSLVSATIPNLKSFVQSFHSGMGIDVGLYSSHDQSGNRTYRLSSTKQNSGNRSQVETQSFPESSNPLIGRLRPEHLKHTTTIHHSSRNGEDSSHNSQEMIIRRDVMWNVQVD